MFPTNRQRLAEQRGSVRSKKIRPPYSTHTRRSLEGFDMSSLPIIEFSIFLSGGHRIHQMPSLERWFRLPSTLLQLFCRLMRGCGGEPFDLSQWSRARVNIDCHIVFDTKYYSVPYNLVHELVEVARTLPRSRSSTRASGWRRTCAHAVMGIRSR